MSGFSDYLENELLDHILRAVAYPSPTNIYASLHNADPGETGVNEITGGTYARQAVTFDAASIGSSVNNNNVVFNDLPAETITHIALWDASTGGNCLFGGALTASKNVTAGESITLAIGDLIITLD